MAVLLGIVVGSLVAYLVPGAVLWLKPALQPAFAVTMLFVGTLVQREQLDGFLAKPGRTLSGLAVQYTVMPLAAWAVSQLADDPAVRVGIVLVGCMPGAMASNVMTVLFRGDLVLSVAMTTVATLAAPLVLSLWLPLLAGRTMDVPVAELAWNAAWMVAIPVAIGIALRRWRRTVPAWWDRTASAVASVAIVLIILVVVAANRERLAAVGGLVLAAMLILNLAGYAMAYAAGRLMAWPAPQLRTLILEVGLQNAGLGSVLALGHLGAAGAVPSAFYTFLCVFTASLALPVAQRLGIGDPEVAHPPAADAID